MTTFPDDLDRSDPGEEAAIQAIAAMAVDSVRRDYPRGTLARRDAHAKHHAIVRAEFRVEVAPAELRHGLFSAPRSYPAWIRFSNGSPMVQPDSRRDQRGMAIKLMDVPGSKVLEGEADAPTQDFVLASFPRFFIRNVRDYVAFTHAAMKRPRFRVLAYFFHGMPWQWRLHELRALTASLRRADDVLGLRYWSQTPYRLGPHVVKYSARPLEAVEPPGHAASPDFLRERLAARLGTGAVTFEFLVQRRIDPAMSLEDSTVEWDEARAPFARVATITIPSQRVDALAQMALAEEIAYTPWHTLPEHAPLGGMNRTRRVVYEAVSRARHELNGTIRREPVSLDPDQALRSTGAPGAARKDVP